MKYTAITRDEVRQMFGDACTVDEREGYVVGPDLLGRVIQVSIQPTLKEAMIRAKELNRWRA